MSLTAREAFRVAGEGTEKMTAERLERVAVAGAGLMGTGIAHAFASAGFTTVLADVSGDALARAQSAIGRILDDGVRPQYRSVGEQHALGG